VNNAVSFIVNDCGLGLHFQKEVKKSLAYAIVELFPCCRDDGDGDDSIVCIQHSSKRNVI
jgi:hypothetical protein